MTWESGATQSGTMMTQITDWPMFKTHFYNRYSDLLEKLIKSFEKVSLFELVHDFLQYLHPDLDLQINLRFIEVIPNDLPYSKACFLH